MAAVDQWKISDGADQSAIFGCHYGNLMDWFCFDNAVRMVVDSK